MTLLNPYRFGNPLDLSPIASASSTGATITVPATAQAGDLAVLAEGYYSDNDGITDPIPAGWLVAREVQGSHSIGYAGERVLYKKLEAADVGATITGLAIVNNGFHLKMMRVFRPVAGEIGVISKNTWSAQMTTGNPAVQNHDPSSEPGAVLFFAAGFADSGGTTNVDLIGTFDAEEFHANKSLVIAYTFHKASEAKPPISVDMIDEGNATVLVSGYLTFT